MERFASACKGVFAVGESHELNNCEMQMFFLAKEKMNLHLADQEVIALARAFGTYEGHPKCRAAVDVPKVVLALQ